MAYPEEIVSKLTVKFGLSENHQHQLTEALMAEGVQMAIEKKDFNPENLVVQLGTPDAPPVFVLHPVVVQQMLADPALLANQNAWLEWNRIKYEIERLNFIKRSAVAERRRVANEILDRVEKPKMREYISSHGALFREYMDISAELRQHANARVEPIDAAAQAYFIDLFKREGKTIIDIAFIPKGGGVQLGRVMKVTYQDSEGTRQEINFYIKTHQHGSLSASRSGSVENVDLKEVLVYKVLEYVGYGPKTHYFFNPLSPGGFFIATQDTGFTKASGKEKVFETFDRIVAGYERTHTAAEHDSARRSIIALDMLSRILRITDTAPNPGNYGRVTVGREQTKWKLLDFRIASEDIDEIAKRKVDPTYPCHTYLNESIFHGFLAGNGAFNYDAKAFFMDIFKNPATERRKFEMAHNVMMELRTGRKGRKIPLLDAITRTSEEIKTYALRHNESLRLDLNTALSDLNRYLEAVRRNFEILVSGIDQKCAELTVQVDKRDDDMPSPRPGNSGI